MLIQNNPECLSGPGAVPGAGGPELNTLLALLAKKSIRQERQPIAAVTCKKCNRTAKGKEWWDTKE